MKRLGLIKNLRLQEFKSSPLYNNLLVSEDGLTTAMQVNLQRDDKYFELLNRRNDLSAQLQQAFSADLEAQYQQAQIEFRDYNAKRLASESQQIDQVRAVLAGFKDNADVFLGGITMITADMITFIEDDLMVFGTSVLLFLILMLAVIFRKVQWIVIPLSCCFLTALWLVGLLALS